MENIDVTVAVEHGSLWRDSNNQLHCNIVLTRNELADALAKADILLAQQTKLVEE